MDPSNDPSGHKQLFDAIVAHHDSKVSELLAGGMDPNAPRHFGRSPLTQAVVVGTDHTVRLLIDHGADPNAMDEEGETALDCALWENRDTTVALLLSMGADPERTQGGVEYMLDVMEDRAEDCREVLAPYLAHRQADELDKNTLQSIQKRPKPRI